jgi:hypothetical protein
MPAAAVTVGRWATYPGIRLPCLHERLARGGRGLGTGREMAIQVALLRGVQEAARPRRVRRAREPQPALHTRLDAREVNPGEPTLGLVPV